MDVKSAFILSEINRGSLAETSGVPGIGGTKRRNGAKGSKITQRRVFALLSDVSIEINHFLQTFYLIFHSDAAMLETHTVEDVAAFTRVQNVC